MKQFFLDLLTVFFGCLLMMAGPLLELFGVIKG